MLERTRLLEGFLNTSKWKNWAQSPITGDASSRRYTRLINEAEAVIMMDDPSGGGVTTTVFRDLAIQLSRMGVFPPEVLAHDPDVGIMVLTDLGPDDFSMWLSRNPTEEKSLYEAAIDVLLHLQDQEILFELPKMTPTIGGEMVGITANYYLGQPAPDLSSAIEDSLNEFAPIPDTLALRDFHAENLIWRPDKFGLEKVGLLDFQDAFIAPRGYDLTSLLRDARRDIAPNVVEDMIAYFIDRTGATKEFKAQLACLGAQRNLRILGVFARLAKEEKKTHYLELLPRVWRNLQADLCHPALYSLRDVVNNTLPAPNAAILKRLSE